MSDEAHDRRPHVDGRGVVYPIFIENLHRSSGPFLYVSSHVWCDLRGVALALLKPGSGGVPLNPDRSIVKPGLSVDLKL